MGKVKMLALAGATALSSTAAFAADLPAPRYAVHEPAPLVDTGGWYLRGDVGVGAQSFKSSTSRKPTSPPAASGPRAGASTSVISRTPFSSAPASAMRGTAGCVSTSPANIAPT
jgi:opacity protein-like surface antigen